jgi:HAD superfamily hydrolase (TIGR01548 family)
MIARFVRLCGGEVVSVPWEGASYPLQAVLEGLTPQTAAVAVVSPNNPTGAVASRATVERLCEAAPGALFAVDHAYVEFGGDDLTALCRTHPNVVALRTLSKAWGLAGLRVGFAVADPTVIGWLKAAGHPYAVSGPSVALASRWLRAGQERVTRFVARVSEERAALEGRLLELGGRVSPSAGNFAFARVSEATWLRDALAGLGIGVRAFPGDPQLGDAVRITCPGDAAELERLDHALLTWGRPEAILFDMDGVLADVTRSYNRAIRETAAQLGAAVTAADVAAEKQRGDANNDWILTRRLLSARGVEVSQEEVTRRFEALYQGTAEAPGLHREESLLIPRAQLAAWAERFRLGVVTGRPRLDAERFLAQHGLTELFDTVVVMEDGPRKPDPAPVRLALQRLGATRAWMIGDTPDDIRAARAARVLPIGVTWDGEGTPEAALAMTHAGAACVLSSPAELQERLP